MKLVISDNVQVESERAFFKNLEIEELYLLSSVTHLGKFAFFGCINLKKVVIYATISEIPDFCFFGCTALESVVFKTDTVISFGENSFAKTGIVNFIIPDSI